MAATLGSLLYYCSMASRDCKKKSYENKVDALINLADISRDDRPGRKERRAYFCYNCNAWHLTSQPETSLL